MSGVLDKAAKAMEEVEGEEPEAEGTEESGEEAEPKEAKQDDEGEPEPRNPISNGLKRKIC